MNGCEVHMGHPRRLWQQAFTNEFHNHIVWFMRELFQCTSVKQFSQLERPEKCREKREHKANVFQ
jgi:hypothetical protein